MKLIQHKDSTELTLDVFSDPGQLVSNVGVNTRIFGGRASNSPRNNANKSGFSVNNSDKGAAAVALATVNTALHISGAGHSFGDHLLVDAVGILASVPTDLRNGGGAHDGRRSSRFLLSRLLGIHLTPTRNQHHRARFVQTAGVAGNSIGKASWLDEFVEGHWSAEFDKSHIVAHLI